MKLCIISHAYIDSHQRDKLRLLAQDKSIELFVIVPKQGREYGNQQIVFENNNEPFKIYSLDTCFTGHLNTFWYKKLQKTLKAIKPDIIQIEEEYWTNSAWHSIYSANKVVPKAKIVLQTCENLFHDWNKEGRTLYEKWRMKIFSKAQQYVFRNVDCILDQEQYITGNNDTVLMKHGYTNKRFALPQLGISETTFSRNNKRLWKKPLKALVIGRLEYEKGIDIAIDAIGSLSPNEVTLEIIGNGTQMNNLQKQRECFPKHNIFFSESVAPNKMMQKYFNAHFVIVPSRTTNMWQEQFGRVIIEGIAADCLVLGASSGSIPYILPKETVFKEQHSIDLAQLLQCFINSKEKYFSAVTHQRQILHKYTNATIVSTAITFYKSLLQKNEYQ